MPRFFIVEQVAMKHLDGKFFGLLTSASLLLLASHCGGGGTLAIVKLELDGAEVPVTDFAARHGATGMLLGS